MHPSSSSNSINNNYIHLAANAELDRIVHFQLPEAILPDNGLFAWLWTPELQISDLETRYHALRSQEAALNTVANSDETNCVNDARAELIRVLDTQATPETKAKLCEITKLFQIANQWTGEVVIEHSQLSQLPTSSSSDSDMLISLNEHIQYLTKGS